MKYQPDPQWLKDLFPQGITAHESILISGPGKTGKPLVELAFVASWLKAGGAVIGIPLQYAQHEMVSESMKQIYHLDFNDYPQQVAFIDFNPQLGADIVIYPQRITANLLHASVWQKTFDVLKNQLTYSNIGILIYGSALNLLLFNDFYHDELVTFIGKMLAEEKAFTPLFTVSNNVFAEEIKQWENAADNVLSTVLDEQKKLTLKVEKIKSSYYAKNEIQIPISPDVLHQIEKIAQSTRNKNIFVIKNAL